MCQLRWTRLGSSGHVRHLETALLRWHVTQCGAQPPIPKVPLVPLLAPGGKLDLGQPWDLFDQSERQLSSKTVVISCTRLTRNWKFSNLGDFFGGAFYVTRCHVLRWLTHMITSQAQSGVGVSEESRKMFIFFLIFCFNIESGGNLFGTGQR